MTARGFCVVTRALCGKLRRAGQKTDGFRWEDNEDSLVLKLPVLADVVKETAFWEETKTGNVVFGIYSDEEYKSLSPYLREKMFAFDGIQV